MIDHLADVRPELRALAEELLRRAVADGHALIVTQGKRTPEEQAALYASGRTVPGPVVTWTLESKHVTGEAFDFAFLVDGRANWDESLPWERIGEIGESLGLRWGGRWKTPDRPHFELAICVS